MQKTIILLACLLICNLPMYAQIGNVKSKHTKKHIDVLSTRLSIIPPKNFHKAQNFVGFQSTQNANHAITIMDLVGGSFYSNAKNVAKENFINRGIKLNE